MPTSIPDNKESRKEIAGYTRNDRIEANMLPVEIVFHPSWWNKHEKISFDEDFFYHPQKRVEVERRMEMALYERWGEYGLGEDRNKNLPCIGAVHLAVDFIISEMLGCSVEYSENQAPAVLPAKLEALEIDYQSAFRSAAYKRFEVLEEKLRTQYGYLLGDTNWGGILNVALDLRGQDIFLDFYDQPNEVVRFLSQIALVIEKFCQHMLRESGSTSISCNRTVRHIREPVMLHSECSHAMISVSDYERFLMRYDADWSRKYRPYGIHYCGTDPHRYAQAFASLPHLDFLDVGWGADVSLIRRHLPNTFLNIRLSPVELLLMQEDHIRHTIVKLVHDSNNPWLTGVCCINLDSEITNEKVSTILETVKELRLEYGRHT